jgi:hypothetical protein
VAACNPAVDRRDGLGAAFGRSPHIVHQCLESLNRPIYSLHRVHSCAGSQRRSLSRAPSAQPKYVTAETLPKPPYVATRSRRAATLTDTRPLTPNTGLHHVVPTRTVWPVAPSGDVLWRASGVLDHMPGEICHAPRERVGMPDLLMLACGRGSSGAHCWADGLHGVAAARPHEH